MKSSTPGDNACARCPAESTIDVLGGRWKAPIIWQLLRLGTLRFGELRKTMPGVTPKVLTQQLRELGSDGVVARKVYAEVPPKVEYSLTSRGKTLKPVIDAMCKWGLARGAS